MTKSKKSTPMQNRVLAIDPGFDRLGIAIVEKDSLIHSECFLTNKKESHEKRLLQIGDGVKKIINKFGPQAFAIETLFFNQNATSALGVAEARGVALYEAAKAGLPVYEYSPQAVKIAVTGYGKADKAQVESMVRKLIKIEEKSKKILDDEMDAIALCITHLASHRSI